MGSPNDNVQMRDGLDSLYKLRTKDVSTLQDGSLQVVRHLAHPYPVDYGVGGCYQRAITSGVIGAGMAAASPIIAFRNFSPTLNALVRRVKFLAWSQSAGFTAGIAEFDLQVARDFTVMDTGGVAVDLSGDTGKLRTSMAAASCVIQRGDVGPLTAGTRALYQQGDKIIANAPTTANTVFVGSATDLLFEKLSGGHPLLLAQNEGFVVSATVPATGTWSFTSVIEWDEVPLVNY